MAIPKILTVEGTRIVLDEVIFAIPEFKKLYEHSKGDLLPFMYIWAMQDPTSPYMDFSDLEKEEEVLNDFPVHDYLSEMPMVLAIKKAEKLYYSPIRDILDGARAAVKNVSIFLRNTPAEGGRDGTVTQIVSSLKSLDDIIKNYSKAEAAYLQEVQKNRAQQKNAVDENVSNDYED